MNRSQFGILNWFARVDNQASPGRLARAMEVTRGAITNTLKKLEANGLVVIQPDENSGRQKVVTMTTKGRKTRNAAIEAAAPIFSAFLAKMSADELGRLIPQLEKVRRVLDEARD